MTLKRGSVGRSVARLVRDENLDLYILAISALTFTLLGFLGTDIRILSSVILALLAVLALSQIRSRKHVSQIAFRHRADPLALFMPTYPQDFTQRRSTASTFLFIGESMVRMVQAGRADIRRMLLDGGEIRIMLLDPTDKAVVQAADRSREQRLRSRIRSTLDELESLRAVVPGNIEIRVSPFVPRIGIYAFDLGRPNGVIYVQHYEYRSLYDSAPVFRLEAQDGFWYEHFAAEAGRMWEGGVPWPHLLAECTDRTSARRPSPASSSMPDRKFFFIWRNRSELGARYLCVIHSRVSVHSGIPSDSSLRRASPAVSSTRHAIPVTTALASLSIVTRLLSVFPVVTSSSMISTRTPRNPP
jgi:hypothetical protein